VGKKGGSRHLKRKPAPKYWPIHRKEAVWTVKPKPGPHPISRCLPLTLIIRDILGFAKTRREAKKIISQGKLMVDGKVRREELFPAGLMDVISIPEIEQNFRIISSPKGLILHPISKEEATFKLCRIEDKTTVKGGHLQLNLHDGSNILVKVADPKNPEEDSYKTMDILKLSVPEREILEHVRLKEGLPAIIIGGKNMGKYGKILEIEKAPGKKRRNLLVTLEDNEGKRFQTILDFVFVVGEKEPYISLPEVAR